MEKELVTHGRGSEWVEGGGGGTKCWLSVKISSLCRLSVKFFDLSNDLTDD